MYKCNNEKRLKQLCRISTCSGPGPFKFLICILPCLFKEIKREAMMQLRMSTADANKPENSFLNRYRDVKPYDHTRVKLETHHDTDYINASLVRVRNSVYMKYCWVRGNYGTISV